MKRSDHQCRVLTGPHSALACPSLATVRKSGSYRSFGFSACWLVYNQFQSEDSRILRGQLKKSGLWYFSLVPSRVQTADHTHLEACRNPHLINNGIQGFVLCTVFQTLSNPGVDGPVSQVPTVGTVSKSK